MANWSEGMRKLRKQEAWVKQRELKLAKMKRTGMANPCLAVTSACVALTSAGLFSFVAVVERLKRRHRDVYEADSNDLSGPSDSSSDEDDDETRAEWSDYSNQSELASTLEKLERLEEELACDAGSFSGEVHDRFRGSEFHPVYQVPQSYAIQREAPYRYPLTSSLGHFAPRRGVHTAGDLTSQDPRWIRSQRTAFGLR